MRIRKSALVSLATLGCIVGQEPNGRQKTEPGGLDFTLRPQPRSIQQTEPGKLDFTFPTRLLPRPTPQNTILRSKGVSVPDRQRLQSETPSPCSIPLLEAPIPKDTQFTIRQFRPRMDNLARMPQVNAPAPACVEKQ